MSENEGVPQMQEQLRAVYDNLPEEEKNGTLGRMIQYAITCVFSAYNAGTQMMSSYNFINMSKSMENIINLIQDENFSKEMVEAHYNLEVDKLNEKYHWRWDRSAYTRELQELNKDYTANMDKIASVKDKIAAEIKAHQQNLAESIVKSSLASSSVVAIIQVIKLYTVFKELKDAENVIKDANFASLEAKIEELKVLSKDLLNKLESNAGMRVIQVAYNKISRAHMKASDALNGIKVKIDNKITRLDVYVDTTFLDGVSSLGMSLSGAHQAYVLWSSLTNPYKIIAAAIPLVFATIGIAQLRASYLTQKRIDELRVELRNVKRLRSKLDEIEEVVHAAETWIENNEL